MLQFSKKFLPDVLAEAPLLEKTRQKKVSFPFYLARRKNPTFHPFLQGGAAHEVKILLQGFLEPLISDYQPKLAVAPGLQRAAILVPICDVSSDSGPQILFTKRSARVRHHKGEISFPGGLQEDGEALEETALRETREELGASPFRVLGRLDDFITITDYVVAPFVGYTRENPTWAPNKEVERIIQLPLAELLKDKHWETRTFYHKQQEAQVHFFQWLEAPDSSLLEGEPIWGATAHILRKFLAILRSSPETIDYLQSF